MPPKFYRKRYERGELPIRGNASKSPAQNTINSIEQKEEEAEKQFRTVEVLGDIILAPIIIIEGKGFRQDTRVIAIDNLPSNLSELLTDFILSEYGVS